jgi:hypothetical protein
MKPNQNIIPLASSAPRGVIIDAASFAAKPFQCAEANYAALFALCGRLLNQSVPFMAMFDRKTLKAQADQRWSVHAARLMAFYPYWFHRNLAGANIVDEISGLSISLNATIISARLPLVAGQPPALSFQLHRDLLVLPALGVRLGVHQSLESSVEKLRHCLQYDNRYEKHLVWSNQQPDLEAA